MLAERNIQARLIDMHTVKPLDIQAIELAARETKGIIVAEEHLAQGGRGATVAMAVARNYPVPMRFINLGDKYAESGKGEELMDVYGLSIDAILETGLELASIGTPKEALAMPGA